MERYPAHEGLQTAIYSAPEFNDRDSRTQKIALDSLRNDQAEKQRVICGLRSRYFWLIAIAALLVAAAVVGGVVGGLSRHKNSPPLSNSDPSSSSSSSAPSGSPAPALPQTLGNSSSLASVAWNDTNGVMQYRVYFQDANDTVKESTWNSFSKKWYVSNEFVAKAKRASPLATAVKADEYFEVHLFTVNETGNLNQWLTTDGTSWSDGQLNSLNVVPSNSSALAAIWHRYPNCSQCLNNLFLTYEDSNSKLNLGNATNDNSWQWSILDANPIEGSGLAMSMKWGSDPVGLRIYYQSADDETLSWLSWDKAINATGRWDKRDPRSKISLKSPLAAFTYGTLDNKLPAFISILSSDSHGVTVNRWSGVGMGEWLPIETPSIMGGVNAFSALAANADAHVYALQDNAIKEFRVASDGTTWSLVGDVETELPEIGYIVRPP